MDLLNQAKEFIARKASKLAMAAVPLGVLAAAGTAKATTVVLDPNYPGQTADYCYPYDTGSCTLTTNATGGNSFLNQVVLTGSATTNSGGQTLYAGLGNSGSGTSNGGLLTGNVPVSWVFAVNGNSGAVGWSVDFWLVYSGGEYSFSTSGSTSGGQVTGSGSISVPTPEAITAYGINITASGSSSFTLTAPLTLNSTPASSAPEPGALLLMGAGGAALLLVRKKRV